MIFESLREEEFYKFRDLTLEGSIMRLKPEIERIPQEEWTKDHNINFTWDFKNIDKIIRNLFEVLYFSDADNEITPVPHYEYQCKGGKNWGNYQESQFEITIFKSKGSMSFKHIPIILLAKFFDYYNHIYPQDQPTLAFLTYSGTYVVMRTDMTSNEFLQAMYDAS